MPDAPDTLPDLDSLRRRIARLEGDGGGSAEPDQSRVASPVPLGHPALDDTLGGGLRRGDLHEIRASEANGALAFGFAAALAARLCAWPGGDRVDVDRPPLERTAQGPTGRHRPGGRWTLIVTTFDGAGEWGRPYGPGLAAFGLDPGRLLIVETRRPREALWAAEEGLSSRALAAVLAEIRGDPAVVDMTATRRLTLRAARSGVTAMLVRPGAGAGLSAARTRWRISPPADLGVSESLALPQPAWQADLERNAARPGGCFTLMWKPDEHVFTPAPPLLTSGIADPGTGQPGSAWSGSDWPGSDRSGTAVPRRQAAAPAGRTAEGGSADRPAVLPLRRAG
ncbi:hypothetical protein [Microbaculum marinum]|uniref:Protein ImuA n=1 Tax=Microbaculum marinum TaxID=1764581 RepID=A0AAW9S307_9HYPH